MGKIVTGELQDKPGSLPKVLQPGNAVIKVLGISYKVEPFPGEPVNLYLSVEGEEQPEPFEGFAYDRDKPELGNAKGQVGRVRATQYNFTNDTIMGKQRDAVEDMKKWLMNFFKAIDMVEWLKSQGDFDTMEELIQHVDKHKPFKDIWLMSCLAGKAYPNKEGYTNYDLYLPWFTLKEVPLEKIGTQPSRMIKFNGDKHIQQSKKKNTPTVEGFEGKPKAKGTNFEI